MIQHSSGKRGRLSVKNEARKRTAIRGYLIRKDSAAILSVRIASIGFV